MLEIRVPIAQLQVGDVICDLSTDFLPETITKAPWRVPEDAYGDFYFETDKHQGENCWRCTSSYTPIVQYTKAYVPAHKIADELEKFDKSVVLEVLKFFCLECGTRHCGVHR